MTPNENYGLAEGHVLHPSMSYKCDYDKFNKITQKKTVHLLQEGIICHLQTCQVTQSINAHVLIHLALKSKYRNGGDQSSSDGYTHKNNQTKTNKKQNNEEMLHFKCIVFFHRCFPSKIDCIITNNKHDQGGSRERITWWDQLTRNRIAGRKWPNPQVCVTQCLRYGTPFVSSNKKARTVEIGAVYR